MSLTGGVDGCGVGWGGLGEEDDRGGGDESSRNRTAASMESSSKGLRLCFTPAVTMAVRDLLGRGLICFWGGLIFGE